MKILVKYDVDKLILQYFPKRVHLSTCHIDYNLSQFSEKKGLTLQQRSQIVGRCDVRRGARDPVEHAFLPY